MTVSQLLIRLLAITTSLIWLSGCEYFDRRETISLHAGDAVASNIAIHTIDPWPYEAANQRIPGDGQRTADAVERYRKGEAIAPRGLGTTQILDGG
jgi:hypothetical protein